jgi:hypothetical protein
MMLVNGQESRVAVEKDSDLAARLTQRHCMRL